jgi:hypothetical protein
LWGRSFPAGFEVLTAVLLKIKAFGIRRLVVWQVASDLSKDRGVLEPSLPCLTLTAQALWRGRIQTGCTFSRWGITVALYYKTRSGCGLLHCDTVQSWTWIATLRRNSPLLSPQTMNAACDTTLQVTTEYAVNESEKLFDKGDKVRTLHSESVRVIFLPRF